MAHLLPSLTMRARLETTNGVQDQVHGMALGSQNWENSSKIHHLEVKS